VLIKPKPFNSHTDNATTIAVNSKVPNLIKRFCRFNHETQLSYFPLAKWSILLAKSNSVERIAKPLKTVSQPGPGYGIRTIPSSTTNPPLTAMKAFLLWRFTLSKLRPNSLFLYTNQVACGNIRSTRHHQIIQGFQYR